MNDFKYLKFYLFLIWLTRILLRIYRIYLLAFSSHFPSLIMLCKFDLGLFTNISPQATVTRWSSWQWCSIINRVCILGWSLIIVTAQVWELWWSSKGGHFSLSWLLFNSILWESEVLRKCGDSSLQLLVFGGQVSDQFQRIFNILALFLLLGSKLLGLFVLLLINFSFFVHHVNLELLNSVGTSEPLGFFCILDIFVKWEEDDLEVSLSSEHVQDLEVLFVVSSLDLVVVHWELRILLLVRLQNHTDKECSSNSEKHLLGNPEENDRSKHEEHVQVVVLDLLIGFSF